MKKFIPYLLIILVFFLLSSLWGFYISIKPPKIKSSITPSDYGMDYESISFTTKDQLILDGWFIHHQNPETAKTIILLHGYPADKGDILPLTHFLNDKYNLLYFDFRYLGESEGRYSTAGALEKEDLLTAIRFLRSRGIDKVGVWGFSMGGAVALMAAPEAPEIKAIVSDSAYARLQLMAYGLYRIPVLRYPLGWLTSLWGRVFMGLDIGSIAPAESVKDLDIPILIIHSKEDEVILFKNALLIQESLKNNPKAEFWFQENLIHGQAGRDYQNRILDFFERSL